MNKRTNGQKHAEAKEQTDKQRKSQIRQKKLKNQETNRQKYKKGKKI